MRVSTFALRGITIFSGHLTAYVGAFPAESAQSLSFHAPHPERAALGDVPGAAPKVDPVPPHTDSSLGSSHEGTPGASKGLGAPEPGASNQRPEQPAAGELKSDDSIRKVNFQDSEIKIDKSAPEEHVCKRTMGGESKRADRDPWANDEPENDGFRWPEWRQVLLALQKEVKVDVSIMLFDDLVGLALDQDNEKRVGAKVAKFVYALPRGTSAAQRKEIQEGMMKVYHTHRVFAGLVATGQESPFNELVGIPDHVLDHISAQRDSRTGRYDWVNSESSTIFLDDGKPLTVVAAALDLLYARSMRSLDGYFESTQGLSAPPWHVENAAVFLHYLKNPNPNLDQLKESLKLLNVEDERTAGDMIAVSGWPINRYYAKRYGKAGMAIDAREFILRNKPGYFDSCK